MRVFARARVCVWSVQPLLEGPVLNKIGFLKFCFLGILNSLIKMG